MEKVSIETDVVQIDVFLDVDVPLGVLTHQVGRRQPIAVETMDRGQVDVDGEPAEEPDLDRHGEDEEPAAAEMP